MAGIHPKTICSKVVYKNPWMRVREDRIIRPDGNEGIYGFVESNDSVMIVVLNDNEEIYLINVYRYPDKSWNWELPGGGGEGEEAVVASKRELVEETGIIAKDWTLLGETLVCNGFLTERQSTYLARNLSIVEKMDQDEAIRQGKFYSLPEIHNMIQQGKIDDGQSLTGLYLAERWLNR